MSAKLLILPGVILAAALISGGCASTESGRAMERQIAELKAESARNTAELTEIRKQLAELKEQKDNREKRQQTEFVSLRELFENMEYGNIPAPLVQRYLDLITPPENASREARLKYIDNVAMLRINVHSERLRTRIINSLTALGHDFFEEMVRRAPNSAWIQEAVRQMVLPADKPFLKRMMNENSQTGYLCRNLFFQLADDSDKADILKLLKKNPDSVWQTAVRLGLEKETAAILKEQMLMGKHCNSSMLTFILKHLTDEERQKIMARIWENANHRNDMNTIILLAKNGYAPAFAWLFVKLPEYILKNHHSQWLSVELLAMTPCRTFEEMADWCRKNRDSLVFDPKTRRYEVKK